MKYDVGIIGGTGIGSRLLEIAGKSVHIPTSYGMVRARELDHEGYRLLLLSRHSAGHKVPPHHVNYRGIAEAVKRVGVKGVLASAAVGCLRKEWEIGTFVACSDMIDLTFRNLTMFDANVKHTDMTTPFNPLCHQAILDAAAEKSLPIQPKGCYLAWNGPRYESPAEIGVVMKLGGDVVGMTATSESVLMRESGVPYGCLAVVTNLAAGLSETLLNHQEVEDVMNVRGEQAVQILLSAASKLASG